MTTWTQKTEIPLMAAAVAFLAAYAAPIIDPDLPVAVQQVCGVVVWGTWALFVVDYVVRLVFAENRWAFIRAHPLELAAATLPVLRPLRLLRLVVLLEFAQRHAATVRIKVGTYVAGGGALLVLIGGLAITDAERGHPDALITNVGDGWWWAFVSMTTVGYGDYYPITATGRLVAVGLMLAGIAVIGSVTGMFASWMVEQVRAGSDAH